MYELGIIGGMGPLATVEFFRRIIDYTQAQRDQEHIDVIILNKPSIPDRTEFIIDKCGESPLPAISQCVSELLAIGVKTVALPCNTSHLFLDELAIPDNVTFVNMIEETIIVAKNKFSKHNICVLATTSTHKAGIYDQFASKYFDRRQLIYPEEKEQTQLMEVIYQIKAGEDNEIINKSFVQILNRINDKVPEIGFIIACTELSLINKNLLTDFLFIDALDILALKTIQACGHQIKEDLLKALI